MPSNKFIDLLKELNEATRSGLVRWYETADDDAFRIRIGDNLVRVESYKESQGLSFLTQSTSQTIFAAVLLNNKGKVLDEVDSKEAAWIKDLFELARVSALGIDEIATRMLEDLRSGNFGDVSAQEDDSE